MDRDRHAWFFELIRCMIAIVIINYYGGWFTLNNFLSFGTTLVMVYFIISVLISIAFDFFEFRKDEQPIRANI